MTHLDGSTGTDRLLQLSLYVQAGMRLLPIFEVLSDGSCACGKSTCTAVGKHPRVDGWQYVATTREETLRLWHDTWPTCNWAWAVDEDQYVVDCDPRNGGPRTERLMDDWAAYGFTIPLTRFAYSGGGGVHIICRCDEEERPNGNDSVIVNGTPIPGVNVKGRGGYVLVAPSNHTSGGFYRWHDTPMTPLSEWPQLVEQLKSKTRLRQRAEGNGQRAPVQPAENQPPWSHRDADGRVNIDRWLRNASEVPSGEQHDYLVSGVGWLRRAGRSPEEIRLQTRAVAENFVNYDETNPWTRRESEWTADDGYERWEAAFEEGLVIHPEGFDPARPPWLGPPPTPDAEEAALEELRLQLVAGDHNNTDEANAQAFARRFGHEVLWDPTRGWYVYNGKIWAEDVAQQVRRKVATMALELRAAAVQIADNEERDAVRGRASRAESAAGARALLDWAQSALVAWGENGDIRQFDEQHMLLPVANGTVDLTTGELRPFNPADLFSRLVPTNYIPDATSGLLDEYLETFIPEPNTQEVLFRVLGGCLLGENWWRTLIVLFGPTTTGKSQLAQMLQLTLGPLARTGNPSIFRGNLDDKPRPDVLHVLPSRMAVLEEASAAWELHADKVKHMTGRTTVSVRGMRSDVMIERVPVFTPIIVTNEMPRIKGADEAIRRRLVAIKFERRPPVEDAMKRDAFLSDERTREALLARLVSGCRGAQQQGATCDDLPFQFQLLRDQAFSELDDIRRVMHGLIDVGAVQYLGEEHPTVRSTMVSCLHEAYVWYLTKYGSHSARYERLELAEFGKRLNLMPDLFTVKSSRGRRVAGWVVTNPEVSKMDTHRAGQLPGTV